MFRKFTSKPNYNLTSVPAEVGIHFFMDFINLPFAIVCLDALAWAVMIRDSVSLKLFSA